MRSPVASIGVLASLLFSQTVWASNPTDYLMNGDSEQSNYLSNHNMDPNVISSDSFGQMWHFAAPPPANGFPEQFFAKPLVYTPSSTGRQLVLAFSQQNRIYALDAINGTLVASRDLATSGEPPFLTSDLGGCNDVPDVVGIVGTPVADPTTDTVYFWAKSYISPNQAGQGWENGAYRFHAIDALTLKEKPGFPVNIQGHPADNDPTHIFTGGNHLNRVSLNLVNGLVVAGFGAHCDFFNYTGWIIGISTDGSFITSYATMGGTGAQPEDGTWNGGGGGGGVWMCGSAIASDTSGRIFFTTGNGLKRRTNGDFPASGHVHLDTLADAIVNLAVDPKTKALTQQDYFEPAAYLAMDQVDQDLGGGAIALPDPATFSGGGVTQMAIACGKAGICYVVNRNNLGGYKMGSGASDAIIQTFTPPGGRGIFNNGATYPLEGGYFYITPVGSPTYVYSLGFSSSGVPTFNLAAHTNESTWNYAGTAAPTITTYKGQPGTAILWLADPANRLRAYYAVPQNGKLVSIPLPASPAFTKNQRPVFGDGRYYVANNAGSVYGYGSPSTSPLACNSLSFGSVFYGQSVTMNITCNTVIPITSFSGITINNVLFQVQNSTLPTGPLAANVTFSFPVVFNLTNYVPEADSSGKTVLPPQIESSVVNVFTVNGQSGYSKQMPISVSAKATSSSPIISINPLQVSFPGIIVGITETSSTGTLSINNIGTDPMTILGYAFAEGEFTNTDTDNLTNVTTKNGVSTLDKNGYFTSSSLPPVGTVIQGGSGLSVDLVFNSTDLGNWFTTLIVYSNHDSGYSVLIGSVDTAPVAVLQSSTSGGPWVTIPNCSNPAGCTTNINMGTVSASGVTLNTVIRLSNTGGSSLEVDKSKPPENGFVAAANPSSDLAEGLLIAPGSSSNATILFIPSAPPLNSPNTVYAATWILNVNDPNFGVHILNFTGTVKAHVGGPLNADKSARYQWLGCYQDIVLGPHIEPVKYTNTNKNQNALCQNQSLTAGYVFAGTELINDCYVGNVIPGSSLKVSDSQCSYQCSGDNWQTCGGQGGFLSVYYDTTRYFPQNGTINAPTSTLSTQSGTSTSSSTRSSTSTTVSTSISSSSSSRLSTTGSTLTTTSSVPVSTSKAVHKQSVGNYGFIGCYTEGNGVPALSGATFYNYVNMTMEWCAASCNGYTYFGVEYGTTCFCANSHALSALVTASTDCNIVCAGNQLEYCGGASDRLEMYKATVTFSSTISSTSTAKSSTSSSSSLTTSSTASTSATSLSSAPSSSTSLGSASSTSNSASSPTTSSSTSSTSLGSASSSSSTSSGSASTSSGSASSSTISLSTSSIAPSSSSSTSTSKGSASSSTTSLSSSSAPSSSSSASSSSPSSTASLASTSSTSSSTSSSSTSSRTLSSSASMPTTTAKVGHKQVVGNYQFIGCYTEGNGVPALTGLVSYNYINMTMEWCAATCAGYTYFGVENGATCYCGNSHAASALVTASTDCNLICTGNQFEYCGQVSRLEMYKLVATTSSSTIGKSSTTISKTSTTTSSSSSLSFSTSTTKSITTSSSFITSSTTSKSSSTSTKTSSSSLPTTTAKVGHKQTVGKYQFIGCYTEGNGVPALSGVTFQYSAMTMEWCAASCAGYTYFGVENGSTCSCANTHATSAVVTASTDCNLICAGNQYEYCGQVNKLEMYKLSATTK